MGYSCDVCQAAAPVIYCFADKAVMCAACDRKVHEANALAKKHERVALKPQMEGAMCDICQEEKAIMFCSEDRAVLCRTCDLMIHTANEFTKTHHRHLLSNFAVGLHPLPAGATLEPVAMPTHSTRRATAKAQQAQTTGGATTSAAPSTPSTSAAASPRQGGASTSTAEHEPQLRQSAAAVAGGGGFGGSGGGGMQRDSSLGSLIDMNPLLRNRSEALGGQMLGSAFDTPASRSGGSGGAGSSQPSTSAAAAAGPSSSNAVPSAAAAFFNDSDRTISTTLAADLLGMPSLPGEYNAKDIDAVYFGDGTVNDLEDWSSFLEVPDFLGLGSSQDAMPPLPSNSAFDQPVVSVRDPKLVRGDQGTGASSPGSGGSPAPDGVVPEVPAFKKQRV